MTTSLSVIKWLLTYVRSASNGHTIGVAQLDYQPLVLLESSSEDRLIVNRHFLGPNG